MTIIAACLYHGEVIFPRADEIVSGRYVRRRMRPQPIRTIRQIPSDVLEYSDIRPNVTQVSRPLLWLTILNEADMIGEREARCRLAGMLKDDAYRVRTKLHELEREAKDMYRRMSEAEREWEEFKRKDGEGAYDRMPWQDKRIVREHYESNYRGAKSAWVHSEDFLKLFKQIAVPTIWPINKAMLKKGTSK